MDDRKKKPKKKKKLSDFSDNLSKDNEKSLETSTKGGNLKRSAREKKPNYKDDLGYVESKSRVKDARLNEVFKRCERMLTKIRKHNLSERFVSSTNPEVPCLNEIEKKLKAMTYTKTHQFAIDVRKVWSYYFKHFPDLYQTTLTMSQFFEEIFSETEEMPIENNSIQELSKKLEKIESQMKEQQYKSQVNNPKKVDNRMSIYDKPMTITEKNILGNNIRMLSNDQLRGIIQILSDQYSAGKNGKYFEFDIESLPNKKLRDLDKYVRNCLKNKTPSNRQEDRSVKQEKEKYTKLKVIIFLTIE